MTDQGSSPILAIRGVRKSYRRGVARGASVVQSLAGVDLEIEQGEITAILGKSGSGKSTLGRCLAFLESPDEGEVLFHGGRVDFRNRESLGLVRRRVQMVFQDPARAISPYFSVEQTLMEPFAGSGANSKRGEHQIPSLLERVGLSSSLLPQRARNLSGGQAQRLVLARAMATDPEVLILDESFAGLDLSLQAAWVNLLLGLVEEKGLTCVLITHDEALACQLADRIVSLKQGRVVSAPSGESR